jgi:hypothetical protein
MFDPHTGWTIQDLMVGITRALGSTYDDMQTDIDAIRITLDELDKRITKLEKEG